MTTYYKAIKNGKTLVCHYEKKLVESIAKANNAQVEAIMHYTPLEAIEQRILAQKANQLVKQH